MWIKQRRAIERRLQDFNASYPAIAREIGVSRSSVTHIASAIGHKRDARRRMTFMVRAQQALLAFRAKSRRVG